MERREPLIELRVIGTPGPQGSKRHVGRGVMIESSKKVKPWRQDVKYAAMMACSGDSPASVADQIPGPVDVEMIFTMPKPKSAPKRRKTLPDRKPDLSKLVRSTEDALTEAGVWEDDARVVRLLAKKVFPGEDPDALPVPGAVIRIRSIVP